MLCRLRIGFAFLLLLDFGAALFAAQRDQPERSVRLRVEWGGEASVPWSVRCRVTDGTIQDARALGIEVDDPGSVRRHPDELRIERDRPRGYDGFDVALLTTPDTTLTVTVGSAVDRELKAEFVLKVAEIGHKPFVREIERIGTQLMIRRVPGDLLKLRTRRKHLIFDAGELFANDVVVDTRHARDSPVDGRFEWEVRRARHDVPLEKHTQRLQIAADRPLQAVPIRFTAPMDEGVYDLVYRFQARRTVYPETRTQFVVLAPKPTVEDTVVPTQAPVDSFRLDHLEWNRRVKPTVRSTLLRNPLDTLRKPTLKIPQLPWPGAKSRPPEDGPLWDAFWLRVERPGRPHRLVVSTDTRPVSKISFSLLEPNAAGQLAPIGLDVGRRFSDTDDTQTKTEILFWPKVRQPVLLFHGTQPGGRLGITEVALHEASSPEKNGTMSETAEPRLVGPYLRKPLLPENFGGTEFLDPDSGKSLDDWQSFLTATQHLVEYLHYTGSNAVQLSVLADGSTIYPSSMLEPTPRFDTGAYASTGQDPLRKDVVELLLRLLEQNDCRLLPTFRFTSPLPALERQLNSDDGTTGILLVRQDGGSADDAPASETPPRYNILDRRVQQAVKQVIQEFLDRYQDHAALAGIALDVSAEGYLRLPGVEWASDPHTIARFERESGHKLPQNGNASPGPRHDVHALSTSLREEWTRWRCAELARFFGEIQALVSAERDGLRLVLSGLPAEDDRAIHSKKNLIREMGIDRSLLPRNRRFIVQEGVNEKEAVSGITVSAGSRRFDRGRGPRVPEHRRGRLIYSTPTQLRLPDFDAVSPWQPALTWLVTQTSDAPMIVRQQMLDALIQDDAAVLFAGGWMAPMVRMPSVARIRRVIRELPDVAMDDVPASKQPVVIRTARAAGKSWFFAANDFPHPVSVRLWLSCAPDCECRELGYDRRPRLQASRRGGSYLDLTLGGYGLWGVVVDDDNTQVTDTSVSLPAEVLAALQERIDELGTRMEELQARAKPRSANLRNPGFESPVGGAGSLSGWQAPVRQVGAWSLDSQNPRSGDHSVVLHATDKPAALLSSEIDVHGHRALTMSLWLRSNQEPADVRLSLEGRLNGQSYRQTARVGVGRKWRRYLFQVRELPRTGVEETRIRIEVHNRAKLWVDDVEVTSNELSTQEIRHLAKVHAAIAHAWEENRLADCQRLLDSYWGRLLMETAAEVPQ